MPVTLLCLIETNIFTPAVAHQGTLEGLVLLHCTLIPSADGMVGASLGGNVVVVKERSDALC